MTIAFTVYNATTGEIKRVGNAMTEASARAQAGPGERVVLIGSDPFTEKVEVTPIGIDPSKLPKTPMKVGSVQTAANKTFMTANGTDAVTISPIPTGATYDVTVPTDKGVDPIPRGTVNDGSLSITTTVAGIYTVTIKYDLNLDYSVTINAA